MPCMDKWHTACAQHQPRPLHYIISSLYGWPAHDHKTNTCALTLASRKDGFHCEGHPPLCTRSCRAMHIDQKHYALTTRPGHNHVTYPGLHGCESCMQQHVLLGSSQSTKKEQVHRSTFTQIKSAGN